jgi:ATP-binding cassette subfamily B protein
MSNDSITRGLTPHHRLITVLHSGRDAWRLIPTSDRLTLALAGLFGFLASSSTIVVLALVARLIEMVQVRSQLGGEPAVGSLFGWHLGLMGLVFLGGETLRLVARLLVQRIGTRLGKELTIALAMRQHRADLTSLGREPVGERLGRLLRGTDWFVRSLALTFLELLPALFTLVVALGYALLIQPWIGLVLVCVIPAMLFLKMRQLTADPDLRAELIRSKDRVDGIVLEQFAGIEYIRAANTSGLESNRVAGVLDDWSKQQLRHYFQSILFTSWQVLSGWLFQFAVLAVAVALTGMGKMSITDIAVYGNLFFSVYIPLWRIQAALEETEENAPRSRDLLAGLAEAPDRSLTQTRCDSSPSGEQRPPVLRPGAVVFETREVVVEYHTMRGPKRALDKVSLKIATGEIVAVAGRSGSGKSTLARLLLRLVHPTSGQTFLNGMPLERVTRAELAHLVGYVGQEPFLFAGTVADNIAYGQATGSAATIRRAAEAVGLHEEILAMPGGYDTQVGERGRNLSGGQRQRLALARVLLHNPPVLLLDEATSALDGANERRVLRALAKGRVDRTVLLVAHRPAALRAADRVIVFEDGQLVEDGTYSELIQRGGSFAAMVGEADTSRVEPVMV